MACQAAGALGYSRCADHGGEIEMTDTMIDRMQELPGAYRRTISIPVLQAALSEIPFLP